MDGSTTFFYRSNGRYSMALTASSGHLSESLSDNKAQQVLDGIGTQHTSEWSMAWNSSQLPSQKYYDRWLLSRSIITLLEKYL